MGKTFRDNDSSKHIASFFLPMLKCSKIVDNLFVPFVRPCLGAILLQNVEGQLGVKPI